MGLDCSHDAFNGAYSATANAEFIALTEREKHP